MEQLKQLLKEIRELTDQIEQSINDGDVLTVKEIAALEAAKVVLGSARDIQIVHLRQRGYRCRVIAEHFGISQARVSQILKKASSIETLEATARQTIAE